MSKLVPVLSSQNPLGALIHLTFEFTNITSNTKVHYLNKSTEYKLIDRRYEKDLWKTLFWTVWYPMVFWLISLFTTLVSFPKVLFGQHQKRARWVSPDRGIKPLGDDEEEVIK